MRSVITCVAVIGSLFGPSPTHAAVPGRTPAGEIQQLDQRLAVAVYENRPEQVLAFVQQGADPNARTADSFRFPLLYLAATQARPATIEALLRAGANPNARDARGTPILVSVVAYFATLKHAGLETVRILLSHGADPNAIDRAYIGDGRSALHLAAAYGHAELVEALLAYGARVDQPNRVHETPLYVAAERGEFESVQLLLQAGANADAATKYTKMTPLLAASEKGFARVAQLLLKSKVNIEHRDAFGRTPLEIVKSELKKVAAPASGESRRPAQQADPGQKARFEATARVLEYWLSLGGRLSRHLPAPQPVGSTAQNPS
ncbi:MAG: ankyrin repeat domain-containing protein [Bacteriovoracia bacterium]